jgi:hypothetical protein
MRIRNMIIIDADPDADPDSTFHPDAYPLSDPDSRFQIKAQVLEKVLKSAIFHTFLLVICNLMRIPIRFRIQLITLTRIRILFDADAG